MNLAHHSPGAGTNKTLSMIPCHSHLSCISLLSLKYHPRPPPLSSFHLLTHALLSSRLSPANYASQTSQTSSIARAQPATFDCPTRPISSPQPSATHRSKPEAKG
ncbi:hypothetical protein BKA56DRAFT_256012 [Ilyonectria sp. MPI-CAGE-AT-0026]|nr:hypothetical protein BKA56DRAFT_256012 [Ilyonectria sp. MPI-CAGE-AT-0026]